MGNVKRKPLPPQKSPRASEGQKQEEICARIEEEMNRERLVAVLAQMVLHHLDTLRRGRMDEPAPG